jgi:hypothetical protein
MNPKVKLCDGCLNQRQNCRCPKLKKPTAAEASKALFDAVRDGWK